MLILFVLGALAQDPIEPQRAFTPPAGDVAEYRRLASELQLASSRNAWSAVERIYQNMHATLAPVDGGAHLMGARAAMDRGDVTTVQSRLRLAVMADPDLAEASEWLDRIDSTYGGVSLMGDVRVHRLEAGFQPFQPELNAAIQYAVDAVNLNGQYIGLLPAGDYRFGTHDLTVEPHGSATRIDVRSDRTIRRMEREARR